MPDSTDRDYVAIARQYTEQVVSGEIPACHWVIAACQRQIDDLERTDWQWTWDAKKAARICYFIERLPHVKGRWKSRNLVLEPWQCFVLSTIFGWVGSDGYRRFRKALVVIPRKNGKTSLAAAVGLYLLALDEEPGAEVYSAATTRDQAKISWEIANSMVKRSPSFSERWGVSALTHSIAVESNAAFFKPLSRDADSLEGLNPHGVIIDELHAHKTREVFDVLDEATASRQQPLIFIISTEGDNAVGVFVEQVTYGQQVLDGNHQDDSYFAAVWTLDKADDWTAPLSWRKANPNLGVSVLEKDMEIRCRQAEHNAESQSSFLTKRLNVRVGAGEAYFNMLAWNQLCADPSLKIESFYDKPCFIGLDLASKQDVTAKIYLFDNVVFGRFYLPEDRLQRGGENYDLYRGWAERGFLTLIPGGATDFAFIERDLLEDDRNYRVQEVAYDPHIAWELAQVLTREGMTMSEIPQNVTRLSWPMKELAARISTGRMRHDGNPMLAWMMGNVMAKVDANDNVFPRKARPENKIDGPAALIMAMSRSIVFEDVSYTGLRTVG